MPLKDFATKLSLVKGGHPGEQLALEELQGGSATGGDVGHLLGETGLLDSSDRVTTADDGDAALASQASEGVGNTEGSLGESLHLEHAHGSVPNDGLTVGKTSIDVLKGLGANIKAHPSIRDVVDTHNFVVGVLSELVGDSNVVGDSTLTATVFQDANS